MYQHIFDMTHHNCLRQIKVKIINFVFLNGCMMMMYGIEASIVARFIAMHRSHWCVHDMFNLRSKCSEFCLALLYPKLNVFSRTSAVVPLRTDLGKVIFQK